MAKANFPDKLYFIVNQKLIGLGATLFCILSACQTAAPKNAESDVTLESDTFDLDSENLSAKPSLRTESNASSTPTSPKIVKMRPLSLSPDGFPKIKEYFKTQDSKNLVIKREYDLNNDGKIDFSEEYSEDGAFVKSESSDLDGDGTIETTLFFEKNLIDKDPQLVRQEIKTLGKDRVNVWKFFDKSKIVRREIDRNNSGRPDYWEYYSNGKLTRIDRDENGDGFPDSSPQFQKAGDTVGKEPNN